MHLSPRLIVAAGGVLVTLLVAVPAHSTSLPARTLRLSTAADGTGADGSSERPVLSSSGRVLAFDTTATNIIGPDVNGPVRDVVAIDLATNERRLVSQPPSGAAPDGISLDPSVNSDGQKITFTSVATNLVPGDTNGQADIFLRNGRDAIQRVSVATGGGQSNGQSGEADVSADGNLVVFTSAASNLVANDTNGQPDVFVRDLKAGTTVRVSIGSKGVQANQRSMSPAISANGRYVTFASFASNLVAKDNNGVSDIFVRDIQKGTTERVSVATSGRQQNKGATPPFVQVSDISEDGRYVVFDSDATTLYANDINQHTDVFLRDRKSGTTTLVSASSTNVQGNNDSFAPRISTNGRFLSFQSFATNLAPGDGPREDIFLRDIRQGTTSTVTVTSDGSPRGSEQVSQLLQRPAISNDGTFAAFSSTVTNLVGDDTNGQQDVFVRLMDPPVGRLVSAPKRDTAGTVKVAADDPLAKTFLCQFDVRPVFVCGADIKVRPGDGGTLRVRAGGAGMLFDTDPLVVRLSNDTTGPKVRISPLRGNKARVLRGRASDKSGVRSVEVGVVYLGAGGCSYLTAQKLFSKRFTTGNCFRKVLVKATGTKTWRLRLPRSFIGAYAIYARATDKLGNTSKIVTRKGLVI